MYTLHPELAVQVIEPFVRAREGHSGIAMKLNCRVIHPHQDVQGPPSEKADEVVWQRRFLILSFETLEFF